MEVIREGLTVSTADQSVDEFSSPKGMPVDLEHYSRRRLFECFRNHPLPVLSICTAIDITGFGTAVEARGLRFYTTLCCLISSAINASPCFRHRIVDDALVEFSEVHPSITVGLEDGNFGFADADLIGRFGDDYKRIRSALDHARAHPNQEFRGGLDNRFFLTHLPWLSFTGIQHPYTPAYGSIPLISTGRSFLQDGKEMLPIAVQAHHALVDGAHVARFLEQLTRLCRHPEVVIDGLPDALG
jgi:chloramphenicol O-acetyltransferase type A